MFFYDVVIILCRYDDDNHRNEQEFIFESKLVFKPDVSLK